MNQIYSLWGRGCITVAFLFSLQLSYSQPIINYQPVPISTLTQPVDFVNAGDGTNRVFIVQRNGVIQVFDAGFSLLDTFLTVTGISTTGGEQGLLSMAFHPLYEDNGHFFVYYTNTAGDVEIARYRVSQTNENVADPDSRQVLFSAEKNISERNHNGGDLNFGPDGNLYVGIGDAGGSGDPNENAQDPQILYGKMIRINVDNFASDSYTIPADNPYANSATVLPEIWAFGLRNPWRWSFDRQTGDMWIADVGQGAWEEVNFVAANTLTDLNFGWDCYEGIDPYEGPDSEEQCAVSGTLVEPIHVYPHPSGGISVTGGFVYRGSAYPLLVGHYIMADFSSNNNWVIRPDPNVDWVISQQPNAPEGIVSFGETESGEMYMLTLGGGLYQVTSTTAFPVTITSFTAAVKGTSIELVWNTEMEQNVSHYEVEYSTDNRSFQKAGNVPATGSPTYSFMHFPPQADMIYYRLKAVDLDLTSKYSKVISARIRSGKGAAVVPTVIQGNILQLQLDKTFDHVQVVDLNGRIIWRSSLIGRSGRFSLNIPALQKGTYLVRIVGKDETIVDRIFVK